MWTFRATCIGLLAILGCEATPTDTYFAHQKPAQVATVRPDYGVILMQLNDYLPRGGERSAFEIIPPGQDARPLYNVPAGRTRVIAEYFARHTFGETRTIPKEISFDALPNHRYTVEADIGPHIGFVTVQPGDWDVKILDRDTDQVVARTQDREKRSPTTMP